MNESSEKIEAENEDVSPKRSWRIPVGVFVVLTIYVLGTGPVCSWEKQGKISNGVAMTVYLPLIALSETVPVVNGFFQWYVELWMPKQEIILDPSTATPVPSDITN